MPTTTLRGPASNLNAEWFQTGAGEYGSAGYQVTLEVGGRSVRFTAQQRPAIGDGDDVIVAVRESARGLYALAYRNLSNGTESNAGRFGSCAITAVAFLICLLACRDGSPLAFFAGGMAACLGVFAARVFEAVDLLRHVDVASPDGSAPSSNEGAYQAAPVQ